MATRYFEERKDEAGDIADDRECARHCCTFFSEQGQRMRVSLETTVIIAGEEGGI